MTAIYKRDLSSYFNSMIGYVFIAVLVFFTGIYFMAYNLYSGLPQFSYTLYSLMTILMFAIPLLTMKSMAEERRSRTDQLLLTAPVSLTGVVMGKFLAMATVFLIPVALCAFCPLIIAMNGEAHLLSDYAAILEFFLLACVFASVGLFFSSLTESQVIAAVGTFAGLLILYLWEDIAAFLPGALGELAARFSFVAPLSDIINYSVLNLSGLVLYLSMTGLFLFLTVQTLQKRRWT